MKDFVINNRLKFINKINNGEIALFFNGSSPNSTADSVYPFRPNKNFFYFTGIKQESFILLMSKYNNQEEVVLFIKKPNPTMEKWVGRYLTKEMSKQVSGIEKILFVEDFNESFNRIIESNRYNSLHLDLARVRFDITDNEAIKFAEKVTKRYPYLTIKNSNHIMSELRLIKDKFEVEQIQEALQLTKKGLERILTTIKPGQKEYQAVAEFQYSILHGGADREAFSTIAASGDNGVILHYESNRDTINNGELVLFDLGAQVNEYSADISRTYPANGKFTPRQKEIYDIVLKANVECINILKPGVTLTELNKKATDVLSEELLSIGLIGEASGLSKYYYHSIGHPLGLDTHDLGGREITFEEGMIVTVEPGLYIEEEAIGIRIEDDVLITKDGFKVLSEDIIKTSQDIEAFMKGISHK